MSEHPVKIIITTYPPESADVSTLGRTLSKQEWQNKNEPVGSMHRRDGKVTMLRTSFGVPVLGARLEARVPYRNPNRI